MIITRCISLELYQENNGDVSGNYITMEETSNSQLTLDRIFSVLNPRQRVIAMLIYVGLTNREIGVKLNRSISTIEQERHKIKEVIRERILS